MLIEVHCVHLSFYSSKIHEVHVSYPLKYVTNTNLTTKNNNKSYRKPVPEKIIKYFYTA